MAACLVVALAVVTHAARPPHTDRGEDMPNFRTKYYLLHTDVAEPLAREAAMRLTRMFEEYERRARGLGRISSRLKIYLYADPDDYEYDTGLPNSGGIFLKRLGILARARLDSPSTMWGTLQHECFHQFAYHLIHPDMPVWLNEGLATYFGAAEWTGDGFVTRLRPAYRVRLVQEALAEDDPIPFRTLLHTTRAEWNDTMDDDLQRGRLQYSQSWLMIYFLLHAEDGRYADGLNRHLNDIHNQRTRGIRQFNNALVEMEDTWAEWVAALDNSGAMASIDERYDVVVSTLTSFLARAHVREQTFESAEAFLQAAEDHDLEMAENTSYQWLPWSLLDVTLSRLAYLNELAEKVDEAEPATVEIDTTGSAPQLVLTRADGVVFTGAFTIRNRKVNDVEVTITYPEDQDEEAEDDEGEASPDEDS